MNVSNEHLLLTGGPIMASGAPVALAIGVGYVLGRSHKLRWAVLLGTAAATGRLGGLSTQAIERGTQMLRSSPELAKLTESATGLLQAGRSAAISSMASRAESMTETLGAKTDQLGSAGEKVAEDSKLREGAKRRDKSSGDVEDTDEDNDYDEEELPDEEDEEYEEDDEDADTAEEREPEPSARGGRQGRGSVVRKTGSRR